jgi:hypothetical protein
MITLVGPDEREYHVHQDLLCAHSPYFAAASRKDWKEGQEHRIPLLCDNFTAVGLYVQWIYCGKIFSRPGTAEGEDQDGQPYSELRLLVEALIFGEKIQDGAFKDAVIDSLIASINTPGKDDKCWYPSGSMVDRVYEGTPEGSPLRRLMVDIHVNHGGRKWLEGVTNMDFLKDLAGDLYIDRESETYRANPTASHLKSCGYHHHDEDGLCYSETT